MRSVREVNTTYQLGSVIGSGGTVTATGIDWAPTYTPEARLIVHCGATPSGSLIASLQQSDSLSSGYTTVGSVTADGAGAGTQVLEAYGAVTARYVRALVTCTGGTALCTADIVGKKRTLTV